MAYIQIVYIAQQHHLLRQLFQGCLEPLSITFPHMVYFFSLLMLSGQYRKWVE